MSNSISRPSWKQCAMLLILLSHAVFGSPIVSSPSSYTALSSGVQLTLNEVKPHTSLEEDVFGPELNGRSDRKKRLFYDTVKKAKQAKLLTIGAASSGAVKSIGKSLLKSIATFGIKAIIFNFLYSKINQVLDFKTRLLNNLEHKNKEQNSQYLGAPDSNTASSTISNSTELPLKKNGISNIIEYRIF
ncbi:hypothetical protein PGB90_008796 [Kerria lacca]